MDRDLIEMAKEAKDVDALIRLASENGVDLSHDKAERYFDLLKREEPLADDELDSVAGGKDKCGTGEVIVSKRKKGTYFPPK